MDGCDSEPPCMNIRSAQKPLLPADVLRFVQPYRFVGADELAIGTGRQRRSVITSVVRPSRNVLTPRRSARKHFEPEAAL